MSVQVDPLLNESLGQWSLNDHIILIWIWNVLKMHEPLRQVIDY